MQNFKVAFADCSCMFRPLHINHHHDVYSSIKEIIDVVFLVKQSVECVHVTFVLRQDVWCLNVTGTPDKAAATLETEPTQHSKPTFVWAYIARHMWLHLIRHV
jgi:hypothetical protein